MQRLDRIDFMLTDARVPGSIDGIELARVVRRDYPSVGILMTSGPFARGPLDDEFPVVSKPYDPERIAYHIGSILEGGK